jgi:ribulose-5-phosphate 4-epimerase/fuculose-1-phosphate aldolase
LGFDETTPNDLSEVDAGLKTPTAKGMANLATRFHLSTYEAPPDPLESVERVEKLLTDWGIASLIVTLAVRQR